VLWLALPDLALDDLPKIGVEVLTGQFDVNRLLERLWTPKSA